MMKESRECISDQWADQRKPFYSDQLGSDARDERYRYNLYLTVNMAVNHLRC